MSQHPTVTVIRPRTREGYQDHQVRTQIRAVPAPSSTTPSPHAAATEVPAADFAPRPDRGSATSKNWMERRKAASDPELSPQDQRRLSSDPNAGVRFALALTTTHPNIEQVLIGDRDLRVRQALCKTDDTRRLRWLADDAAWQVRAAIPWHCTDQELLVRLSQDPDHHVSQAAEWKLAGGPYPDGPRCDRCIVNDAVSQPSSQRYLCESCLRFA